MKRIDVHNHFLPGVDDGCRTMAESLECLTMMVAHGYTRAFCTPHAGELLLYQTNVDGIACRVKELQHAADVAMVGIELRPGGEIRLSAGMVESLRSAGIPSYGHDRQFAICDLWEDDWPAWATRAVEWLQMQELTVILAHPERMGLLRKKPEAIDELARLGLLFQGNLGPIAGADRPDVVAAAERFLKEGRYFLVGTDGHRPMHLTARLAGLSTIEQMVGADALTLLTETNPARLWK